MARSLVALAAAAVLTIGCSGEAPGADTAKAPRAASAPAQRSGPALWVVKDSDTTIYLFGTVHLLPRDFAWRSPVVDKAFDAADTLVLEVIGTDDAAKVQPVIMELGFTPGMPPLAERVPADMTDELQAAIRDADVPAAAVDAMETWLATMTLATGRIVRLGYSPESGVEAVLKAKAVADRKRIEALETLREQLGFFDTLPEAEQRTMLAASLDDLDNIEALVKTTVADWVRGDVDKVAAALEEDISASPALAKRLLTDRNANWAAWIDARLRSTPGTVFVAVGTGHLAGSDSVQAKLRERGLHSVRLN